MPNLFIPTRSQEEADRRAQAWSAGVDGTAAVGRRHHIVPRFLLARFANDQEQLTVRNRVTGVATLRKAGDLGYRDFYTAVTHDGTLDASLELLLSEVEGAAAEVIHSHFDATAFSKPRPFSEDERFKIDTFVSMQFVRGMRVRRGLEIVTDYGMKLVNQHRLSADDVESLDIVPHPNDHLRMMPTLSENAAKYLESRPLMALTIDRPLFITGDEPVVLPYDGPIRAANPNQFPSVNVPGIDPRDIVQMQGSRGIGIADATEVVLAVSPYAALVYGQIGSYRLLLPQRLTGKRATRAAAEHNGLIIDGAVDWAAAHPAHPSFAGMSMPDPKRIVTVMDGGSAPGKRANADTTRRLINRLGGRGH